MMLLAIVYFVLGVIAGGVSTALVIAWFIANMDEVKADDEHPAEM